MADSRAGHPLARQLLFQRPSTCVELVIVGLPANSVRTVWPLPKLFGSVTVDPADTPVRSVPRAPSELRYIRAETVRPAPMKVTLTAPASPVFVFVCEFE